MQVTKNNIKKICKILGVARSSYYCTQKPKDGKLKLENNTLSKHIIRIYNEQDGVYGAPKIREEILKLNVGFMVSVRRVGKIMKSLGLRSVVIKKYRPQKTDGVYADGENLLNRDFSADKLGQKWLSDITYIHTLKDGWVYLASILDLATNKIIGFSMSKNIDTALILSALNNAIVSTGADYKGVILHSDRGCQYTSHLYRDKLKALGINQSFSAKGCPYDNAPIESWHALLKKEFVYRRIFKDFDDAKLSIFCWIESRYNRNRIHSSLGYLTPHQMEERLKLAA